MKKIFFALIVFFFLLSSPCWALGEWELTGSLNQGRECFCSVILNDGRVLIAGGYASCASLSSCEIYDPETGEWSPTDSMYCRRSKFSLTKLSNGKILATGGYNGGIGPSTIISEIYNPETETWTTSDEVNYFRGDHRALLLQNDKVLVVGGDSQNDYKGCEIYDPYTDEWTLTGFCIYPKVDHTLELLPNGNVMAIGGGNSIFNKVELYDANTETWSEIAPLSEHRDKHTSHLSHNGNVMVIGGSGYNGSPEFLASCEIYDFQTQQWIYADSLEIGRTNHCSELLLNNKILVMGGWNNGYLSSCEVYNWQTGEWEPETPMPHSRANFSSETLINEKILAIGPYYCDIYGWNHTPQVSQPQNLNGLNEAMIGETLSFSVIASDPDEDSVSVRIDWGDNETSEWTELQPSGTTFELSHSWTEPGVYQVRAQSADQWYFLNEQCHNSLSEWGDTLLVTIHGQAVEPSIELMSKMSTYPNPFDKSTTVCFYGAVNSHETARIEIYNIKGKKIRTLENLESASLSPYYADGVGYSITWNGRDDKNRPVTSGIYFYKLIIGEKEIASNKMLLLK